MSISVLGQNFTSPINHARTHVKVDDLYGVEASVTTHVCCGEMLP